MTLISYIGLIGGICSLAGYIPYAKRIIQGAMPGPERVSWLIWTLSNALILLSYWELGARATIWLPAAYLIGSAFMTALAFTYGKEGWGTLEKLALIVAVISSIRWIYFDDPFIALALNMAIGFLGYIPGIIRLAKDPAKREELDLEGWTLFFLGSIFNLIAVSTWTPVIYILPVFIFVMNGAMFAVSFRNSLMQEKSSERKE